MISPSQTQGGYHHLRLLDYRSNACARGGSERNVFGPGSLTPRVVDIFRLCAYLRGSHLIQEPRSSWRRGAVHGGAPRSKKGAFPGLGDQSVSVGCSSGIGCEGQPGLPIPQSLSTLPNASPVAP